MSYSLNDLKVGDTVLVRSWCRSYQKRNGLDSVIPKYEPILKEYVIEKIGRRWFTVDGGGKYSRESGKYEHTIYFGHNCVMYVNRDHMEQEDRADELFAEIQEKFKLTSRQSMNINIQDMESIMSIVKRAKTEK